MCRRSVVRGGRTSKLHALTDSEGRPCVLLLTPGNINGIIMAPALIAEAGRPIRRLLGDKGYDASSLRSLLAERKTTAVIPSTASRKTPIPTMPEPTASVISSNASAV